jgi:hypothetical protein
MALEKLERVMPFGLADNWVGNTGGSHTPAIAVLVNVSLRTTETKKRSILPLALLFPCVQAWLILRLQVHSTL